MSKRTRHISLNDGAVIAVKSGDWFFLTCCDCSLTHKIDVHIIKKEVFLRFVRDERRTSQKRRRKNENIPMRVDPSEAVVVS